MKKIFILGATLGMAAFFSASAQAQNISWGNNRDMSGNPDIITNGSLYEPLGTYFDAADAFGTLTLNNGVAGVGGSTVTFNLLASVSGSFTDGTISITGASGDGAFGSAFTTASPSSTSYQNLVDTGIFDSGGSSTVTIGSLANPLIIGDNYEVESWSYYTGDSPTATTVYSGYTPTSLLNATGQFAEGFFTATGTFETYNFSSTGGHQYLNAVSVRDISAVPEPSVVGLLALGLLGLGVQLYRKRPASKA